MNKKYILFIILLFILSGLNFYLLLSSQKKMAFVRSEELVYNFKGTKEARVKYDNEKQQWQSNLDTLQADFERSLRQFEKNLTSLSPAERREEEQKLSIQQEQLLQYKQAIEEKAYQRDEEIMQGVLNQINAFVEEYGKENNYDLIMGTTRSGNILYGREGIDITDELIKLINDQYLGE